VGWALEGRVRHRLLFVAVSTNAERSRVRHRHDNMFGFWEWVGGRYSFRHPAIHHVGRDSYMLADFHEMDRRRDTPFARNLPVLMALLVWYGGSRPRRWAIALRAVPQTSRLPAAADVKSTKHVAGGRPCGLGHRRDLLGDRTNGQHSFQLIHRGRG
jgi:glucose-6-phosphate isomerase